MALDIGERRIGVAVSDPLGITAQPRAVLENTGHEKVSKKLKEIIDEYGVTKVIAGLPCGLRGERGKSAEKIMEFVRLLEKNINMGIEAVDERFSTALSRKAMLEADASRKTRRKNIDKVAAAVILQGYLDRTED
jgi:putative holliday junction resolvase